MLKVPNSLRFVHIGCGVLRCVAMWCRAVQCGAKRHHTAPYSATRRRMLTHSHRMRCSGAYVALRCAAHHRAAPYGAMRCRTPSFRRLATVRLTEVCETGMHLAVTSVVCGCDRYTHHTPARQSELHEFYDKLNQLCAHCCTISYGRWYCSVSSETVW